MGQNPTRKNRRKHLRNRSNRPKKQTNRRIRSQMEPPHTSRNTHDPKETRVKNTPSGRTPSKCPVWCSRQKNRAKRKNPTTRIPRLRPGRLLNIVYFL